MGTLMVQGTTSDAGKSILVAGLCRWLARKHYSVAPFKPQNMALNSAVTTNGGEIGRAQAIQAIASNIEPHTDMNPILLKPSSDTKAQVIIQGRALEQMEADAYHDYKAVALEAVLTSYHRLKKQYQSIIVEGAGSPAEINLRHNDIANMGFAEAVDCPVVIVADIDKGGVFAHLVGTLSLLSQTEQDRVVGFVINKFRGDIGLLKPGLDWLEQRTGKPVLGVLPYLNNFYLDAEDAIAVNQSTVKTAHPKFTVVVPVFSRISNHTDFDALALHPEVNLTWVPPGAAMPAADLIILPGTKNVRRDLDILIESGWGQSIQRHLRFGGKLMGICGGYQMLGEIITDHDGIEDTPGESKGLGLLAMKTCLKPQKVLKPYQGQLQLDTSSVKVQGYEIHCGTSAFSGDYSPVLRNDAGEPEGVIAQEGTVLGTYIHGIFDQPQACNEILRWAGLTSSESVDIHGLRQQQLNRLADVLEQHLDPDFLKWLTTDKESKDETFSARWCEKR